MIVPIAWGAANTIKHWLVAAVFFNSRQIRIYDSIRGGTRWQQALFERVREMLDSEHQRHYKEPLPTSWEQWSTEVRCIAAINMTQTDLFQCVPNVSQQNNDQDCGIYAILSSICLASMLDPSLATHTAKDISNARIRIANRLNQAIRSCDQNAEALRQSVSRVPTPIAPSQQHSLRGRFPHGCV